MIFDRINMRMETKVVLFLMCLVAAIAALDCTPFGARVQYGGILLSSSSTQKLVVSFNTPNPCGSSFLRLLTKDGFRDIQCQSNTVTASEFMNFFTTYVQQCSIGLQINFEDTFYYNVYGWSSNSPDDPVAGLQDWVELNVIHPVNYNGQINTLTMADWGVIGTTGFTPINESLRQLMLVKKIHLLLVVGDIAYDLDSNNGTQYIGFLKMAEQFISKIPCVFVPGNHENLSEDDHLLHRSTFNLYNVNTNLVTGFQFGDSYFLLFDPYNFVYFKNETINSLEALKSQLAIAKATGLFVIPVSHYPLVCSGESDFCQQRLARMYPYFDSMLAAGVSLYLGAHTHDYERTYPYTGNQLFKTLPSPYQSGQGYLLSVVEGVAGSNTSLITEMPVVNNYTASYTVNETGYGILATNSNNQVSYSHFSTKQGWMDNFIIQKASGERVSKREGLNLRIEEQ